MKLKKMFNPRLRASLICIFIVGISLFVPAVTYSDYSGEHVYQGFELILMGPATIFGGIYLEWIVWLANPLSVMSIVFFIQKKPEAKVTSLIALGLAASFMFWQNILYSESGAYGHITGKNAGYWLWLLSILILVISIQTYLQPKNKKHKINDAYISNIAIDSDQVLFENLNMSLINRSIVNKLKEKYLNRTTPQLVSMVNDARYSLDARLAAKETITERNGSSVG